MILHTFPHLRYGLWQAQGPGQAGHPPQWAPGDWQDQRFTHHRKVWMGYPQGWVSISRVEVVEVKKMDAHTRMNRGNVFKSGENMLA